MAAALTRIERAERRFISSRAEPRRADVICENGARLLFQIAIE